MKNILNKIYIHPLFLLTTFVFILIGQFRFMTYFMMLIVVHEMGHILVSIYFNWTIDKIIILPFGGLTKYNNCLNTLLKEELFVAISGVIFQHFFYLLTKNIITYKYYGFINYFIILFNLIPIYPLDGSKILSVILNKFTNFYSSLKITIIISYIIIFLLICMCFFYNRLLILIFIFLIIKSRELSKNKYNIYNKFLLERYLNNYEFKKQKIINNIYKMKKDYRHLLYLKNKYVTEKTFLSKMFDNQSKM